MSFFSRLLQTIPFECAICKKWPSMSFEGVTGVCPSCIAKHAHAPRFAAPAGLDDCIAAVDFDVPWSALISRYKFAPEPGLARTFAGLMLRDERIRDLIAHADIVMPLPLAPERLEQRGFNQALTLTKYLCARPLSIDYQSLIRTRDTAPQRTLDRAARQRNVANAFAVLTAPSFVGKHILLIDDVMTTGATLAAAAAPLRKASAAKISAVVIARTPLHAPLL